MILSPNLRSKTVLTLGALAKNIQDQVALLPKTDVVLSRPYHCCLPSKVKSASLHQHFPPHKVDLLALRGQRLWPSHISTCVQARAWNTVTSDAWVHDQSTKYMLWSAGQLFSRLFWSFINIKTLLSANFPYAGKLWPGWSSHFRGGRLGWQFGETWNVKNRRELTLWSQGLHLQSVQVASYCKINKRGGWQMIRRFSSEHLGLKI